MKTDRTKRPRRIAADEAHSWARNLKLGNIHAKLVLSMLTLYVDADGYAFVGIPSLAEDCELSADTVRRRLVWLEEIGAVVRVSQWLDENGRRNGEGRGKRTTDLIRLLVDADEAAIEARARGENVDESEPEGDGFSPSWQLGLNPGVISLSPTPALGQPSQSGEGLISEPEPESPLLSPPGTEEVASQGEESEPADFAPAWQAWRGHELMRRDLALSAFRSLSPEKQRHCRAAIGAYNALLDKHRRTTVTNFHIWIGQKGFDEFPDAKLPEPPPERRWVCGEELAALAVAMRMAGKGLPRTVTDPERGEGLWRLGEFPRDLAALAPFSAVAVEQWPLVDVGSEEFAAWRDRLKAWLGADVDGERRYTEEHNPAIHDLPVSHPNFKFRKFTRSLRVPASWPPRRDGRWPEATDEANKGDAA